MLAAECGGTRAHAMTERRRLLMTRPGLRGQGSQQFVVSLTRGFPKGRATGACPSREWGRAAGICWGEGRGRTYYVTSWFRSSFQGPLPRFVIKGKRWRGVGAGRRTDFTSSRRGEDVGGLFGCLGEYLHRAAWSFSWPGLIARSEHLPQAWGVTSRRRERETPWRGGLVSLLASGPSGKCSGNLPRDSQGFLLYVSAILAWMAVFVLGLGRGQYQGGGKGEKARFLPPVSRVIPRNLLYREGGQNQTGR